MAAWTDDTTETDQTITVKTATLTNADGNADFVNCRGAYAAKLLITTVTTDDATTTFSWRTAAKGAAQPMTIPASAGAVVVPVRGATVAATSAGYIDLTVCPCERIAVRAATGTFSYGVTLEIYYASGGRPL